MIRGLLLSKPTVTLWVGPSMFLAPDPQAQCLCQLHLSRSPGPCVPSTMPHPDPQLCVCLSAWTVRCWWPAIPPGVPGGCAGATGSPPPASLPCSMPGTLFASWERARSSSLTRSLSTCGGSLVCARPCLHGAFPPGAGRMDSEQTGRVGPVVRGVLAGVVLREGRPGAGVRSLGGAGPPEMRRAVG